MLCEKMKIPIALGCVLMFESFDDWYYY